MNKMKASIRTKIPYLLLGLLGILLLISLIRNYYNERALEGETGKCIAILIDIRSGEGVRQTATGTYKYLVNGRKYEYEENRNFNDLSIGDTVLIEYSIEDPSVARVVDKYYMQKYKNLKQ